MLIILLIILLSFFSNITFSDTGGYDYYPKTGTILPITNNNIEMISEIVIYSNSQFNAVFYFSNSTLLSQSVTMGFPMIGNFKHSDPGTAVWGEPIQSDIDLKNNILKYYNFKCSINGKPIKVTLTKTQTNSNTLYNYVFIWKTKILPNQLLVITNTYHQTPDFHSAGTRYGTGDFFIIQYILETGSSWKNNIQKADFYFYVKDFDFGYGFYHNDIFYKFNIVQPDNNLKISKLNEDLHLLEWHFRNFKPNMNIMIKSIRDGFNPNNLGDIEIIKSYYGNLILKMQNVSNFNDFIVKSIIDLTNTNYNNEYYIIETNYISFLKYSLYALNEAYLNNTKYNVFFKMLDWYRPNTSNPKFSDYNQYLLNILDKAQSNILKQ